MDPHNSLDERAFESLFREHFKALCRLSMLYVKNYESAREIVQDTFVSLWEKRDTIDLSRPVKSYLSTTVKNKSLNYLRDNRKFNNDLLELEGVSEKVIFIQDDRLVEEETKKRIAMAIEELPEKCREVFLLSRHQNLKYQQIAETLQISVKTVETQMSKALSHLRRRLSDHLPTIFIIFAISLFRYFAISPIFTSG
jgi:RNA polymerase sigma-70 factor (ECF subfamily)